MLPIILQSNIRICGGNMCLKNIDLILTFVGLFLITNVLGALEASDSSKNLTSINKPSDHFKLRGSKDFP